MDYELIAINVRGQEYCVNVQGVREIRGWAPETRLPHAPDFVRGVVNLRGAILPIIDLGLLLGFEMAEPTPRHAILVVEVGETIVGLLVDAVSDIFKAKDAEIQDLPSAATDVAREFVSGIIPSGDRLIGFLNVKSLMPKMAEAA